MQATHDFPLAVSETATFNWTPQGVSSGNYAAMASVPVEDEVYGPTTQGFEVAYNLCYLPSVVKRAGGEEYSLCLSLISRDHGGS